MPIAVLLLPVAAAQQPASQCSRECDPLDPEVNAGAPSREGPVRVFLYYHPISALSSAALLTTPPGPSNDTGGTYVGTPGVDTCGRIGANFLTGGFESTREGITIDASPGLAAPLHVLPDGNVAYVYLAAMAPFSGGGWTHVPAMRVSLRLDSGRGAEPATPYASGAVEAGPIPAGPSPESVWEWRIPLEVQAPVWPPAPEASLRAILEICFAEGTSGGGAARWGLVSTPELPSRIIVNVERPLVVDLVEAVPQATSFFVRARAVSAFGSHDIRPESVRLNASGPAPLDPAEVELVGLTRRGNSDGIYQNVTAIWAMNPSLLAPGAWTFNASFGNLQGTLATWNATTQSVGPPERGTPGAGFFAALGAVALAAGLGRVRAPMRPRR